MKNNFQQRKKEILSKKDKSSIGNWDEKVKSLCDKINKKENYYTTSSCSGRIIIMKDVNKKSPNLFEFVSHTSIKLKSLLENLPKTKTNLKFKSEPPILHVSCKDLDSAKELLNNARNSGWKRSGIITLNKNIIVELISTEKIEFPLTRNGELLVDKKFLEIVLQKASNNLKKGWEKINKLKNSFK